MTKSIILVMTFGLSLTKLQAQEFYKDGSMKLSEISADKKYGYEANHETAIKIGEVENEQPFLKALRGPNGEQVSFKRIGSCCEFESKTAIFGSGLLDKYEVNYQGLNEPVILYLNAYDFETPKVPLGFTFVTANKIAEPIIYPADSIIKVLFCNKESLFSVEEFLLKEKIGELPKPEIAPIFEGGIDNLKKYFLLNPLTDERTKNVVFLVAIAFVVDCNGKAGNFMIITKGKGLAETFANQVLERVNKMPQMWKPSMNNGKNVDSYQVLSFIVTSGELDKVTYR